MGLCTYENFFYKISSRKCLLKPWHGFTHLWKFSLYSMSGWYLQNGTWSEIWTLGANMLHHKSPNLLEIVLMVNYEARGSTPIEVIYHLYTPLSIGWNFSSALKPYLRIAMCMFMIESKSSYVRHRWKEKVCFYKNTPQFWPAGRTWLHIISCLLYIYSCWGTPSNAW